MKIDLDKLITFDNFYNMFLTVYNDGTYETILDESKYYSNKINDYERKRLYNNLPLSPKRKVRMVTEKLRTRCNENNFYKLLVITNSVVDHDTFCDLIDKYYIHISHLVNELNKSIILNKILGNSLEIENDYLEHVINIFENYYGLGNYSLYIFKLYELEALKRIELEKQKTK